MGGNLIIFAFCLLIFNIIIARPVGMLFYLSDVAEFERVLVRYFFCLTTCMLRLTLKAGR